MALAGVKGLYDRNQLMSDATQVSHPSVNTFVEGSLLANQGVSRSHWCVTIEVRVNVTIEVRYQIDKIAHR